MSVSASPAGSSPARPWHRSRLVRAGASVGALALVVGLATQAAGREDPSSDESILFVGVATRTPVAGPRVGPVFLAPLPEMKPAVPASDEELETPKTTPEVATSAVVTPAAGVIEAAPEPSGSAATDEVTQVVFDDPREAALHAYEDAIGEIREGVQKYSNAAAESHKRPEPIRDEFGRPVGATRYPGESETDADLRLVAIVNPEDKNRFATIENQTTGVVATYQPSVRVSPGVWVVDVGPAVVHLFDAENSEFEYLTFSKPPKIRSRRARRALQRRKARRRAARRRARKRRNNNK